MPLTPEKKNPATDRPAQKKGSGTAGTIIRITPWQDWEEIAKKERRAELRELVDAVFSDTVMCVLALLLIPILVIPSLFHVSHTVESFLAILDIFIWIIFIVEYCCRLAVAEDRRAFVTSPWWVFDLIIIVAPAVALLAGTGIKVAQYFRVLRVMQAAQIFFRGGKTVGKHLTEKSEGEGIKSRGGMKVRSLPLAAKPAGIRPGEPVWQPVTIGDDPTVIDRTDRWLDFSWLSLADIPVLSQITAIPSYLLETKLKTGSFTRTEICGSLTTVFLKIPRLEPQPDTRSSWLFSWDDLLLAYDDRGVMTFSQVDVKLMERVTAAGTTEGIVLTGPGILFLIVREELATVENLILATEGELVHLEALPSNQLPSNFLSMMYVDQKVQSRIISGILHTKSALEEVCDHMHGASGKDTTEEGRLRSLIDRCSVVADNAQHVYDSFGWMVDFYLNTTSFSMNSVMKLLAVLTALTMVPTIIGGLLGMNLIGNPWDATLLQMVTVVMLLMLLMAWVYYNLGWLKR
jgi:Mg2+ and Co2+ transporter CorA